LDRKIKMLQNPYIFARTAKLKCSQNFHATKVSCNKVVKGWQKKDFEKKIM